MYRIKIYSTGKNKESWLSESLRLYETRLQSTIEVQWVLCKTSEQLEELLLKEECFIALSPQGEQFSSEEFSKKLYFWLERHGSRLCFAIGGPEGFSEKVLQQAYYKVSFSKLTFTHQMIRLLLLEQIYRATEIYKGTAYHK